MIMLGDKKKMASGIVSKISDSINAEPVKTDDSGVEQDDTIAMTSAAEELMSAISSKDAKAVAAAFKTMMEMCEMEGPDEEASEDAE